MGGASTIDAILLIAARREKVTRELVEVIHVAAGLIAGAMVLLAVSGGAFFLVGDHTSPKFWAKMVIVGVACLNGLAAHRLIFPLIETASSTGDGRMRLRPWPARLASASAAVSSVSWFGALVLGAWHGLTVGMIPILIGYAGILGAAVLVSAVLVAPRLFVFLPAPSRRQRVRSLRKLHLLPAAAAYALALAVADAALAIATRLSRGSRWPEPDGARPFTAPAYATERGWRPIDDTWERSRSDGAPLNRRLPFERFEVEDQRPWPGSSAWPRDGGDGEPEPGWR